jgi:hypothetical protein
MHIRHVTTYLLHGPTDSPVQISVQLNDDVLMLYQVRTFEI